MTVLVRKKPCLIGKRHNFGMYNISQIPCFTADLLNDCLVIVYSVGSPTTALYNLFVNPLDRRWLKEKCAAVIRTPFAMSICCRWMAKIFASQTRFLF